MKKSLSTEEYINLYKRTHLTPVNLLLTTCKKEPKKKLKKIEKIGNKIMKILNFYILSAICIRFYQQTCRNKISLTHDE